MANGAPGGNGREREKPQDIGGIELSDAEFTGDRQPGTSDEHIISCTKILYNHHQ